MTVLLLIASTISCASAASQVEPNAITWHKYENSIRSVILNPTGDLAAVITPSGDVDFWSFSEGKKQKTFQIGKRIRVGTGAFSPDGKEFAAVYDASIVRWEIERPKSRFDEKIGTKEDVALAVAYSEDGRYLAASVGDKIILWDRVAQKRKQVLVVPDGASALAFHGPSNSIIAATGGDSGLRIWRIGTDESQLFQQGHRHKVTGLALCNKEKMLVSCGWDQKVLFWDIERRTILKKFEMKTLCSSLSSCSNNEMVAVSTYGDGVHVFDTKTMTQIATVAPRSETSAVALAPSGKTLLVGYGNWLPPNDESAVGQLRFFQLVLQKK